MHRFIKTIVTFDYVNEPGMAVAEKYFSPALEELTDVSFSRGVIESAQDDMREMVRLGNESAALTANELITSLGWAPTGTTMRTTYKW
jgi:hypothetical protein